MVIDWQAAHQHQATVEALCAMAIDQFYDLLGGMDAESAKHTAMREIGDGIAAYPDIEEMAQKKAYPFAPGERGDTGMVDGEDIPW